MTGLTHSLPLDQLRDGDRIDLVADEAERAELAGRLNLVVLDRLDAHVVLCRQGQRVRACGRLKAVLAQPCVATGEPVRSHLDEPFEVIFMPEPKTGQPEAEIELSGDELDSMFHDGRTIDLGAAVADSLALALDPYPRSPAAENALKEAGVISEEDAGPFAALAALKGKLSGE